MKNAAEDAARDDTSDQGEAHPVRQEGPGAQRAARDDTLALDTAQLRSVLLAQAIESADGGQVLVSGPERDAALLDAVVAAQAAGAARVRLPDVLLPRAEAIVRRAGAREGAIATLHAGDTRWRWLARALPVLALLAGLVADRIGNAHRVDLLSPPLLLVLAWNVAVYAALVVRALRALRRRGSRPVALGAWWGRVLARLDGGRGGLAARVALDFHARWLARTQALQAARLARVLHLAAAAGGAGLALSLLLRGLFVRYQFGWESTFLDAAQVHALARVLFWPLTALTGLAPFSLAEIAATQDFAGTGAAGSRWVWMYVGLLALVVVLPRLVLAAWQRWREARLSARWALDLSAPEFDALRAALPAEVVLGVAGAGAAEAQALAHLLALHAGSGAAQPGHDRLRFVLAQDAAPHERVDAVLLPWQAVAAARLPGAWQGAPVLALPWNVWGMGWVLEPVLLQRLAAALPQHAGALARLGVQWRADHEARFGQALRLLAGHLRACLAGAGAPPDALAQRWQALDAALRALHALPAQPPGGGVLAAPAARREGGAHLAVTSAGAAAGAAAGAKAGALIDVGTGGLTLGAGTALGALLGGAVAWTLRGLQQRGGAADDALRSLAQAACIQYLVIAHQARLPAAQAQRLAALWREQVERSVAAHGPQLSAALHAAPQPGAADPLADALRGVLLQVLGESFPGAAAQAG